MLSYHKRRREKEKVFAVYLCPTRNTLFLTTCGKGCGSHIIKYVQSVKHATQHEVHRHSNNVGLSNCLTHFIISELLIQIRHFRGATRTDENVTVKQLHCTQRCFWEMIWTTSTISSTSFSCCGSITLCCR